MHVRSLSPQSRTYPSSALHVLRAARHPLRFSSTCACSRPLPGLSLQMFSFGSSGGPPAATASSSLFPSSSGAASAAPLFANPPGQQQPQVASAVALSSHPFQYIQQCFDPASPSYRFRFYFYNHVTTGGTEVPAVPEIQKPPSISDKLWAQIQADNPNPQRYVPVIAEGWTALKERSAWQETQSKAQTEKLQVSAHCLLFAQSRCALLFLLIGVARAGEIRDSAARPGRDKFPRGHQGQAAHDFEAAAANPPRHACHPGRACTAVRLYRPDRSHPWTRAASAAGSPLPCFHH